LSLSLFLAAPRKDFMETTPAVTKPFIVPVFIPHAGCPHRCAFCNQHATTGRNDALPPVSSVRQSIIDFLAHRKDPRRWTEISFYGGNFLGLAPEQIQLLLATAAPFVRKGSVNGIRFSTRPDTVDSARLELIAPYPVTTIELGVQSMNNLVLHHSHRGHTADDTIEAIVRLKEAGYKVGVQMMIGLPGDTPASALATGRQLATLAPDFARIYPTLVFRGSPLARWYAQGQYDPIPLQEAVALTAELHQIFSLHDIPVIRMGLQAAEELSPHADLVAGPHHPAFGELVLSALWQNSLARHLEREGLCNGDIVIDVHPRLLSQIKGRNDDNIMGLIDRCQLKSLEVRTSNALPVDTVAVNGKQFTRA